ncbi:hypothetical protein MHYP_G00103680 [Metynnis hypsauchen]
MKILLIFTLFLISGGGESQRVTGYSGGGVLIKCRYERRYTSNPKYLCTGLWPCLTKPIWTDAKNEWINSGRFSLFDDTRASQFWVLITELTVEDSGKYNCAVWKSGIDVYTPVELKVEEDQNCENRIDVVGHVGGGVNISCKYPQSHKNNPKFLCRRVGSVGCNYKSSVKKSRRWINEGKLHLHDDGKQIFTMIINSLTEGDSGEYWCGAESDWTSDHGYKVYITQINLRVTEILPQSSTYISSLTTKPATSSTPKTIPSSLSGSSVVTGVSVIVLLLLFGLLFFIVFLRKRGKTQGGGEPERVTGYSGGGVLIKCRYETQYTSNPKYLCTGPWPCMTKPIWTDDKNKWINSGRFSLFDDTRASQFWVLIRELTVEDTGTYKCGVDKSFIDVYTPVELKVEENLSYKKSISVTGHVGGGVNISCKYPQSHSSVPKFLCRRVGSADCSYETSVKESRRWINEGKLHLHDDGKQIFTVIINNLTEGDSGEYWCGAESDWTSDHGYKVYIIQINLRVPVSSVITAVSVVLLLLLIGLLFFTVTLRKRSKTQVPASTQSQTLGGSTNDHRVSLCEYEEIKDFPTSDAGASTVYSTAEIPTNPSEPSQSVYDNVQLATICDFSNPIYSSA